MTWLSIDESILVAPVAPSGLSNSTGALENPKHSKSWCCRALYRDDNNPSERPVSWVRFFVMWPRTCLDWITISTGVNFIQECEVLNQILTRVAHIFKWDTFQQFTVVWCCQCWHTCHQTFHTIKFNVNNLASCTVGLEGFCGFCFCAWIKYRFLLIK